MIVLALKDEKKDSSLQKIIANIEGKYKIRNDFVVKRTLEWMMAKKMIRSCNGRYHLVTEKVKLCGPPVGKKRRSVRPKASRRTKKRCKKTRKSKKKRSRKCSRSAGVSGRRQAGGPRRGVKRRGSPRRRGRGSAQEAQECQAEGKQEDQEEV